jgi:hypothetical protein
MSYHHLEHEPGVAWGLGPRAGLRQTMTNAAGLSEILTHWFCKRCQRMAHSLIAVRSVRRPSKERTEHMIWHKLKSPRGPQVALIYSSRSSFTRWPIKLSLHPMRRSLKNGSLWSLRRMPHTHRQRLSHCPARPPLEWTRRATAPDLQILSQARRSR